MTERRIFGEYVVDSHTHCSRIADDISNAA